jgi:hypothetical protein
VAADAGAEGNDIETHRRRRCQWPFGRLAAKPARAGECGGNGPADAKEEDASTTDAGTVRAGQAKHRSPSFEVLSSERFS